MTKRKYIANLFRCNTKFIARGHFLKILFLANMIAILPPSKGYIGNRLNKAMKKFVLAANRKNFKSRQRAKREKKAAKKIFNSGPEISTMNFFLSDIQFRERNCALAPNKCKINFTDLEPKNLAK